ncbi:MAG: right-handed parallel beta-helix repeat-containing protein [Bacteroidota bacterium]
MRQILIILILVVLGIACSKTDTTEQVFYVNNITGSDSNDGLSPGSAWKSLEKASNNIYTKGEQLLLCKGCTFIGKLELKAEGSKEKPVIVSSYDSDNPDAALPVIDASGFIAGIHIKNSHNIEVSNIEITADAGTPVDEKAKTVRYGVLIEADQPGIQPNITLVNLNIHDIFATEGVKKDGQNLTSNLGYGISVAMKNKNARIRKLKIEDCSIEKTGHTGIRISGFGNNTGSTYLEDVTIVNNRLSHIGGPGMVPARCENVVVRGNVVDHSGSSIDPRMHARGSGIWPWTCNNVLIEKNKFMHARGKADSCGAHIDFNCNNVVVQYNLSMDNAGGFVEILGNDHNCCYRYNISINDGFREKGENGAHQEGKVLWTSGYVGSGNKKHGPYNSYIYNNTVFVKEDIRSCFSFTRTTEGILIANNIFYIMGETADVSGDQDTQVEDNSLMIKNAIFKNNLFQKTDILPSSLIIKDTEPLTGDPMFASAGGTAPEDYIPGDVELIKDKGIKIKKLPGDEIGLTIGLEVEADYFGNPITGLPDLGAIELK